jgi:hypothetical protein
MEDRQESQRALTPIAVACPRLLAPTFFSAQVHLVPAEMIPVYSVHRCEGLVSCLPVFYSLSMGVDRGLTQRIEHWEHWESMKIDQSDVHEPYKAGRREGMEVVCRSW